MIKYLIISSLLFLNNIGYSQQASCETEKHHEFDFWIGEWEVVDTTGKIIGHNTILKDYNNCLIQENWQSTSTSKGTSYNYFNPSDSSWNQVWIDDQGGILELNGNFDGKSMVLKSDVVENKNGVKIYHQISWTPIKENTVTQHWEVFEINGTKKSDLFYGIYKKK